ncbi:RagB/SusD family nutrient uptake outer membrane protein [Salegentibacter agarivorans]|uniref:RagB/SusD family nutrient uptake outer membrane protein n=1 Tax=Salegentibacter agarivorans TaxID=345907 RepID=UPI001FECB21B|nr:RagB/SusD family nutrient uptake outer membrane protein [Salegentibacter agarivorans]
MSCQEEFLEEVNPNEISTASFWKNNADLESGLNAVYNGLANTNLTNLRAGYNRSDLTWPGFGRPNTDDPFYTHSFNDATPDLNRKWEALYVGIFRANQVIENGQRLIDSYSDEEQMAAANVMVAQARFLRGLFYFYLYTTYNDGSVPLIDFVPKSEEEFFQPLTPAEEIRSFYLADLEFAYENLPPTWTENINTGKVDAAAAAAVLGKSYLYEENYEQANVYFEDVLTNGDYGLSLVSNIGLNFSLAGEFNSESILEISYNADFKPELSPYAPQQVSNNYGRLFAPTPHGGFRAVLPSAWINIAYKNDPIDTSDPRNYIEVTSTDANGNEVVSTELRKYSLRTSASIALIDDLSTDYYNEPPYAAVFNNNEPGYWKKHTNWRTVSTEVELGPNNSGINFRLIRLADVYLMSAECLIKGGTDNSGVDAAMELINEVRHRSALQLIGMKGTGQYPEADHDGESYDAQKLMDHLMFVERPLELAMEGHEIRFLDLRRWGIVKERFEDLATRAYYGTNYPYIDDEGLQKNAWGSVLLVGEHPEGLFTYRDYQQAAQNYIPSEHAYYPIPNSETIANPNF